MNALSRFPELIDVWNTASFDKELHGILDKHAELIRDYYLTSHQQWLEREASDHLMPYPENPHASGFMQLVEHLVMPSMEERAIRTWHYARLTNAEVVSILSGGIYLSTLTSIRARFAAMVAEGAFCQEVADALFADSPFQSEQLGSRSNKFWMVSHPVAVDDSGVEMLLESWGANPPISGSAIPNFRFC